MFSKSRRLGRSKVTRGDHHAGSPLVGHHLSPSIVSRMFPNHRETPMNAIAKPPALNPIHRMRKLPGIVGLSRSEIYRLLDAGLFPRPVKLGSRSVGWRESDLAEWLASRQPCTRQPPRGISAKQLAAIAEDLASSPRDLAALATELFQRPVEKLETLSAMEGRHLKKVLKRRQCEASPAAKTGEVA